MPPRHPPENVTRDPDIPATAIDHVEQNAQSLARKKGHPHTTDADRQESLQQLKRTSPPAKAAPPTPQDGER